MVENGYNSDWTSGLADSIGATTIPQDTALSCCVEPQQSLVQMLPQDDTKGGEALAVAGLGGLTLLAGIALTLAVPAGLVALGYWWGKSKRKGR